MPDMAAPTPAEQEIFYIEHASIARSDDLAKVVRDAGRFSEATALWLQTEIGWKNIRSLAQVPYDDLLVKAVVGQSGGHTLAAVRVRFWLPGSSQYGMSTDRLTVGRMLKGLLCHASWGCFRSCVEQAALELCQPHCRPDLAQCAAACSMPGWGHSLGTPDVDHEVKTVLHLLGLCRYAELRAKARLLIAQQHLEVSLCV